MIIRRSIFNPNTFFMRKIFTLFILIFLSAATFAFSSNQGLLTISGRTQSMKVIIDNRQVNDRQRDEIRMDLRAGYHSIKIYKQSNRGYGNDRRQANSRQLIYSGNLFVKAGFHVDITINRFGKAFIDERRMTAAYNDDDWDDNDSQLAQQPMTSSNFNSLKQTIANTSFETGKLATAKQAMGQNYFTAAQVKELLGLMNFESTRLELAKYAYNYCVDTNNYFTVNDAFNLNSSKEELASFVQQQM